MAASPFWKIFDAHGKYQASCHDLGAAAALMAFYGDGATVRTGHTKRHIVYTEGKDGIASESYDVVAHWIEACGGIKDVESSEKSWSPSANTEEQSRLVEKIDEYNKAKLSEPYQRY